MSPRPRSTGATRARPYAGTQAVRRALSLLKAFTPQRTSWGVTELAAHVGLNKTTCFRLLDALEHEGMVAREPGGVFRLGPELVTLGTQALRSMDLFVAAHTELESLAADTGETATLEILSDVDTVIVDEVHGRHLMGSSPEIGMRFPAHATSTGKVLLAFSNDAAERVSKRRRFATFTERTVDSAEALERDLAIVRRQGYALAVEEIEHGFVAIAAPIRNHA